MVVNYQLNSLTLLNEKHRPEFILLGFTRAIFKLLKQYKNDYYRITNCTPCIKD